MFIYITFMSMPEQIYHSIAFVEFNTVAAQINVRLQGHTTEMAWDTRAVFADRSVSDDQFQMIQMAVHSKPFDEAC